MKPVKFKEQTTIIAKDQPEYGNLPAYDCKDDHGTLITCWTGGFWERIEFLFTGKLWIYYLTFKSPVQPLRIETEYPFDE